MVSFITRPAITMAIIAISNLAYAQTESGKVSLEQQFKAIKDQSNNYQIYEVVKVSTLDLFWKNANDTIKAQVNIIQDLRSEVRSLEKNVTSLGGTIAQRDARLEEQTEGIENMEVFGISVGKSSFVIFSGIAILGLIVFGLIALVRFRNANKVTIQSRKDATDLQEQLEAQRAKTREIETKLKRELQTELNRVVDLEARLAGKSK